MSYMSEASTTSHMPWLSFYATGTLLADRIFILPTSAYQQSIWGCFRWRRKTYTLFLNPLYQLPDGSCVEWVENTIYCCTPLWNDSYFMSFTFFIHLRTIITQFPSGNVLKSLNLKVFPTKFLFLNRNGRYTIRLEILEVI